MPPRAGPNRLSWPARERARRAPRPGVHFPRRRAPSRARGQKEATRSRSRADAPDERYQRRARCARPVPAGVRHRAPAPGCLRSRSQSAGRTRRRPRARRAASGPPHATSWSGSTSTPRPLFESGTRARGQPRCRRVLLGGGCTGAGRQTRHGPDVTAARHGRSGTGDQAASERPETGTRAGARLPRCGRRRSPRSVLSGCSDRWHTAASRGHG